MIPDHFGSLESNVQVMLPLTLKEITILTVGCGTLLLSRGLENDSSLATRNSLVYSLVC